MSKKKNYPHGIMFHHFHDNNKHIKGQGSISQEAFYKLIKWLKKNFNLLNATEWYEKSLNNELRVDDICLTFDDNLLCQYEVALPVLDDFNIKAFWFVYSSPLEGKIEKLELYRYFRFSEFKNIDAFYNAFFEKLKSFEEHYWIIDKLKQFNASTYLKPFSFYSNNDRRFRYVRNELLTKQKYNFIMDKMIQDTSMNIEEVKDYLWMKNKNIKSLHNESHIIGLHSHSHPVNMGALSYEIQELEYSKNKEILETIINDKINSVSYPCNSYNKNSLIILKKLNVSLGFRANMNLTPNSRLEYPRIDHTLLMKKL